MKILFVASVAVVSDTPGPARDLFIGALGLPLQRHADDDYFFSEALPGTKHFGVWPLTQAAEACFGSKTWPPERQAPQACIEFEVADAEAVAEAAAELADKGYQLIHGARTEPWGQVVARLQTTEGLLIGLSYASWLHEPGADAEGGGSPRKETGTATSPP